MYINYKAKVTLRIEISINTIRQNYKLKLMHAGKRKKKTRKRNKKFYPYLPRSTRNFLKIVVY